MYVCQGDAIGCRSITVITKLFMENRTNKQNARNKKNALVNYRVGKVGKSPTLRKFWWNFGREGERRKKGREREKRGGKGKERQGKRGKMERKRREIVNGKDENLKLKGESMKMSRGLFFFFFFACHFLKPLQFVWCTKMEISTGKNLEMGNFLTSSTFDCTPGYAPAEMLVMTSNMVYFTIA